MAFNILDIMNAATKAEAGQNRDYQDIVVNYRDIVVTKHNKYGLYRQLHGNLFIKRKRGITHERIS